jgi:hypothetical protein
VTAVVTDAMTATTMTAVAVNERRARLAQIAQPDATELGMRTMSTTTCHVRSPFFYYVDYSDDCFTM